MSTKREIEPEDPKRSIEGIYILLAEDNKINQKVAKLMLERLGADVTIADNGSIAVEKVAGVRPDIDGCANAGDGWISGKPPPKSPNGNRATA